MTVCVYGIYFKSLQRRRLYSVFHIYATLCEVIAAVSGLVFPAEVDLTIQLMVVLGSLRYFSYFYDVLEAISVVSITS